MNYRRLGPIVLLFVARFILGRTTLAEEPLPSQLFQAPQFDSSSSERQSFVKSNLDLEAALQWTLSRNPDLVALRQNLEVSAAALEVARHFPTSLNPSVSLDVRPWVFERGANGQVGRLENDITVSVSQPIELGHRTAIRESIARAAFSQTQWNILQAELSAVVQTYRLHQTASYRREKLHVAEQLAEFNGQLVQTLRRQLEANQVAASDVALAEVEAQASNQQQDIARQDYIAALTDLRQQIGIPQYAGIIEPSGPPRLPTLAETGDDDSLIQTALDSRPEIRAAMAQVEGTRAAIDLARADRIPIFAAGPVYEKNESGASFYGFGINSPVPVLNTGTTLVRQREAEYRRDATALDQLRNKTAAQVKATIVKWKQARQFVDSTAARAEPLRIQVDRMQKLYEAGQTDVFKLLQVRQRLIESQNARLDALWQASQAYADLLTAMGTAPLIGASINHQP